MLSAGAATASLLLMGLGALTGCTSSTPIPEEPDPLESPARRAEADAALAAAVAQTHPALAAAARALAADRMAHATSLRAELRRSRPGPAPSSTAVPPAVAAPPVNPDLTGARSDLTQAVHGAQDEAAGLVVMLPGYRAALLASVAACCASHAALLS
jgi:hypothetical protein